MKRREPRSPRAPELADSIREAILRGTYASGTKLRQEELARTFSTSVIPLREALHALASEGLVEMLPNRGARVRPVSSRELREMSEVRSALAAIGLKRAAPRMTPRVLARARAIQLRMDRARDPRTRVRLYADFHAAILAPAERPYLVEAIRGIIFSGLRYMPVWVAAWKETGLLTPPPGFERVLDALERKDHAGALRQLKRVWSDQEEMLARFLERREASAAAAATPTRKKAKRRSPKGS
jgi:DNA-binding GntR family transcriptional regulator